MAYSKRYNPDALPEFTEPEQAAQMLSKAQLNDNRRVNSPPTRSDASYANKPPPPAPVQNIRDDRYGPNSPTSGGYKPSSRGSYDSYSRDSRRDDSRRSDASYGRHNSYEGTGTGGRYAPQDRQGRNDQYDRRDYDDRSTYEGRDGRDPRSAQDPRAPPPRQSGSYSSKDQNDRDTLWPIFKSVDKDRSGQLSEQELGAALVNGDYTSFDPHTVRMMIRMFDVDKSGTISFDEFCGLWGFLSSWRKLFDRFDADRSGGISYDEFSNALVAFGYRLSEDYISLLFSTYDSRGKGVLSFDLFVQACISLKRMTDVFKKYDTDRDGYITLSFEQFLTGSQSLFLFNSISPATDKGLY